MRKEQFANDEYYHIFNRGIDGRSIFMDDVDRNRFLECLKEFNTLDNIAIRDLHYRRDRVSGISRDSVSATEPLIKVLCYCLMPNHFHVAIKQVYENGISIFMQKIGVGYTYYFNTRHERRGHLFQGPFKAVLVDKESQFLHLSRYIHLNALDLFQPEWREGAVVDWPQAKSHLESYLWSSYSVFMNKQKSDFCQPELLGEIFKSPEDYENFVKEWTRRSFSDVQEFALE